MRTSVICGARLHERLLQEFDYSPVIRTLLKERAADTETQARDLLSAFLQWIALIPGLDKGQRLIMLKSPVDEVFHAFLLHENLYSEFCKRFFGFPIKHSPLERDLRSMDELRPSVRNTIDLLNEHYGQKLSPILREWQELESTGAYEVSCNSANCDRRSDCMGILPNGGVIVH